MRATASAAYLLAVTFVGLAMAAMLAMGPYRIGKVSDAIGARHLERDQASLQERAALAEQRAAST